MKIVIAGAGEVGSHLAELLSKEDGDVTILDADQSRLAPLDEKNVMTHVGSPTSLASLKSADAGMADLFIKFGRTKSKKIFEKNTRFPVIL